MFSDPAFAFELTGRAFRPRRVILYRNDRLHQLKIPSHMKGESHHRCWAVAEVAWPSEGIGIHGAENDDDLGRLRDDVRGGIEVGVSTEG